MTHKQRMLAACRGETPDRVAWAPRIDIWYNAHARSGTLPDTYRGMSLRQITAGLGAGFRAMGAGPPGLKPHANRSDRSLGLPAGGAFETRLHDVEREVKQDGDVTRVVYRTPVGSVSCAFGLTEGMKRGGASIAWIEEHLLKGPDDYPVLAHIFANAEVVPTPDEHQRWHDWVGEDGVAIAQASATASPMQHIMANLMPMDEFFLALHDAPEHLARLAQSMDRWFEDALAASCATSAEMVQVGGNYDETITYPPFFEEHILPWLVRAAETAHGHGKLLFTHTDGENAALLDLYRRAKFDIADALCPAPMTKLPLAEYIEALPGVTIWGGIPSVILCESAMSDAEFRRFVEEVLALIEGRSHFILGIADTTPPDADFSRLEHISALVNA